MIFNSYFDVLFALNRALHPGAKRQLAHAKNLSLQPENMVEDLETLLSSDATKTVSQVEQLIDRLENLLKERGAL